MDYFDFLHRPLSGPFTAAWSHRTIGQSLLRQSPPKKKVVYLSSINQQIIQNLFVMKEKVIRYEQPQMTVVRFQQQARILSDSHVTKGKDLEWGD